MLNTKNMETTAERRHTSKPITEAWNAVKGLDYSDKLELVTMLINSVKPAIKREESDARFDSAEREQTRPEVKLKVADQPLKRYTMEEINAMVDQSEQDIADGRVYDFDEAMDELEKEFAEEDRKLAMAEAL